MKNLKQVVLILGILFLLMQQSHAATVRLDQNWDHENIAASGYHLQTVAIYDNSSLTGIGQERILLDTFGIHWFESALRLNFYVADFTDPPSLALEGNIFAQYNSGVFDGLFHVDNGGSARILIRNGDLGGPVGGSINITGNQLIHHLPVSGQLRYGLVSSTFTITAVPVPGALVLFASGLFGLGFFGKRKHS